MLLKLHKIGALKIFLWLVILSFLATIFVVWGMGDKQNSANYVAKVNDSVITVNDLRMMEQQTQSMRPYFETYEQYRRILIDQLINSKLLLEETKRLGVIVTDAEVINHISQMQVFLVNNQFNKERYNAVLKQNAINPVQFETDIRNSLAVEKLREIITNSTAVTDKEIELEYILQNTNIDISYFTVDSTKFIPKEVPADSALEGYYALKQENYRVPAQVKAKGIKLSKDGFKFSSPVTEEMAQDRYNANILAYKVSESVKVSHIVAEVTDWNDAEIVAKATDKINKALDELKKGKNFDTTAKKYSDDPRIKTQGADLGTFKKPEGEMSPEETVLFSTPKGKYTSVVKTEYGFHIFKVNEHTQARIKPFAEVKAEIKKAMDDEAYNSAYRTYIYKIYKDISAAGSITAYTQQNPIKVVEYDYLSANDPKAFFQQNEELKDSLFALGKTDITSMVTLGNDEFIFELVDKKESYIPTMEEVYDAVVKDYNFEQGYSLALAKIDGYDGDKSVQSEYFKGFAKQFSSKIVKVKPFSRLNSNPEETWVQDMQEQLFSAKEGDVIKYNEPLSTRIFVIHLNKIIKPELTGIDEMRGSIESYLLSLKQEEAYTGYLTGLRNRAKITVNPGYM